MRTGVANSTLAVSLSKLNTQNAHTLGKQPRKAITAAEGHFAPVAAVNQRAEAASAKTSQTATMMQAGSD